MAVHVFGLTGGIGSGKSVVAARLRARGLPVVDADELARLVVAPGSPGLEEIAHTFGNGVLTPEGELDRPEVASRVFADPEARHTLNRITHRRVRGLAFEQFERYQAQGEPLACYEVPLLFENGLTQRFNPVVVVTAREDTRIARVVARDGCTEAEVQARIGAQLPLADKVRAADHVIDNDGPLEATLTRTDEVLDELCRALGIDPSRYLTALAGGTVAAHQPTTQTQ